MWYLSALIALLAWGGTDLFCKMGTDPDDRLSQWRITGMVGLVMGAHAVLYILLHGVEYHPINLLIYLPVSLLYILAMVLGYAGLRYIELSVSSPICNSSGAVAALLCFAFLGQRIRGLQLAAVLTICAGIFLLSVLEKKKADAEAARSGAPAGERRYRLSPIAIGLPILYCVVDGLGTFADSFYLDSGRLSEDQANLSYEFTFLIIGLAAIFYLAVVKKQRFALRLGKYRFFSALLETLGQFFYIRALAANAIVAAPMIASYSVVSILLSRIVLREKLSRGQYAVIACIMAAIVVLGVE